MDLSDLFVSYKAVDWDPDSLALPEIPTMDIEIPDMAAKVNKIKARMQESPIFQGWVSSAKEPKEDMQQSSSDSSTAPSKMSKSTWRTELTAAYKRAGCNDNYAKYLVAQDALESAWGQKPVGDYNYGNIKAEKSWKGATKSAYDKVEKSTDPYRSYNSIDEYVADKIRLLRDKYHMTGNESAEEFADKLVAGHYATAQYKAPILKMIKSMG